MAQKFLELYHVSVLAGGTKCLNDISLSIHQNEQWAIVGTSGSGKTLLANTLAGKNVYTGRIDYYFPAKKNAKNAICIVEQQNRFKNLFNTSDLYYQQRFNSYDSEQTKTVRQELEDHFSDANFNDNEWLDVLHIRNLLDEPLIQLSNGENKRLQLAIALFEHPELLILDAPFVGLDVEGRKTLRDILQTISKKGVHFLLVTSFHEIPESITNIAFLDKGKLIFADQKINFRGDRIPAKEKNKLNAVLLKSLKSKTENDFNVAISMVNVNVKYGEKQILSGINWEVKKGECWNLTGPNGAGKSTLLSLITADNPQAYANEIYLFDKRRGSGETIWDIKKKLGFISPELHLYFDYSATCFEVVASGMFDTIGLFRHITEQENQNILRWLKLFQVENLRLKRLSQLSVSEQRITLLARALIKMPSLLILDEPCQGLDDEQIDYFTDHIDQVCKAFETTMVYVSHYQNQVPACVNRFLQLENGKIIS